MVTGNIPPDSEFRISPLMRSCFAKRPIGKKREQLQRRQKRATPACPGVEAILGSLGSRRPGQAQSSQCPIWEGKQAHWKPRPPPTGRRDVVTVGVRCAGFRGRGSCQGLQIHYTPVTPPDSSGHMLKTCSPTNDWP